MNIMLLFVGFSFLCVCVWGGVGCWYVIDHLDYVLFSPGGGGGGGIKLLWCTLQLKHLHSFH